MRIISEDDGVAPPTREEWIKLLSVPSHSSHIQSPLNIVTRVSTEKKMHSHWTLMGCALIMLATCIKGEKNWAWFYGTHGGESTMTQICGALATTMYIVVPSEASDLLAPASM